MNTIPENLDRNQVGFGLLLVRLALAREFVCQGSGILFGAFHGPGVNGFAQFAHLPAMVAFGVGLAQLAGGLAILTGIGARLGTAAVIPILVGALTFARVPSGIAMEYEVTLLLIALCVLVAGAGPYSLYYVLCRQLDRIVQAPFG
jgi:putative oxidoreductase